MANERFNRALRAMKGIGLSTDVVSPVLKRLLKLYGNEWELIEEEHYRVLADAVLQYQEEGEEEPEDEVEDEEEEEQRLLPKRGRRNFVVDEEEDYEYVPPLTRSRSGVTIHEHEYRRRNSPQGGDFEPMHVEEDVELRDIKGKNVVQNKGNTVVCGRGKRIAKEAPLPATSVALKKPKIENGAGGGGKSRVSTPPRWNPKVEGSPVSRNLNVINVLPITAVNMASSPRQKNGVMMQI